MFYGWWIVATSALGLFLGPPVVVFSFGVFFKSLVYDFHASRAAVSFAFTLHNVVGALSLPVTGKLVDRFGARQVIIPATIIYALLLLSGRWLGSSIWQFYVFYTALGVASSGCNPVAYGVVISHWFNRQRGLALGLTMLGIGIGAIAVPLVAERLIAMFGWRMAYGIFGGAVLLLPLPVVATFLQNDPADRGLRPDGEAIQGSSERPQDKQGLSWRQIWHSPTFWLLICIFCLTGASMHAAVLHMPALLTDRGLSAQRAAVASALIGISLIVGRTGSGYLLDRFFGPRVAILFYGAAALGMALLWAGSIGRIALAASSLVGLGMGAEVELISYLVSRYFGLRAFGSAFGHAFGAFMFSGAVGTLLMGAGFDRAHSYTAPLAGFCIAMVLALALLTRLGPYRYGVEGEKKLPLERVQVESGA
jgi:MFS family permease